MAKETKIISIFALWEINKQYSIADENPFTPDRLNILKGETLRVPIYKGCPNKECFCTGACKEVIGYRDKHPLER